MEADDYALETVLAEARRFMVPLYQRKYQWDHTRIETLWDDVAAKASDVLENTTRFKHYMGALILSPIGDKAQIGVTPKVQVVDGQQRLTTFLLFLAALREAARQADEPDIIDYVEDYIFNKTKAKDVDELTRYKLTPTPSDRNIFHDIMDMNYDDVRAKYRKRYYFGDRVPKNTDARALRAYDEFYKRICSFIETGPVDSESGQSEEDKQPPGGLAGPNSEHSKCELLEAILRGLLSQMKLVVITLDEADDAQVIFETLNSQGMPLLAMDLVRNNIFHRAEKEENASPESLYKRLWDPFDDPWWRQNAPNARPSRPRIDHFLAHVLASETGQRISLRELYAEYRAFAVPRSGARFDRVEDELLLLTENKPIYETLEGVHAEDVALHQLGRRLARWQNTTAYPVAFQIAKLDMDDPERPQLMHLLYSFIVRRALAGMTQKNYNKVFQGMAEHFAENQPSLSSLTSFFSSKTGESSRYPSDEDVRSGVSTSPLYYFAPGDRTKDILWELEKASRPKFAENVERPEALWTEHVMPRAWDEAWPLPDGSNGHSARWSGSLAGQHGRP